MDRHQLRLELLRLTYTHGRDSAEAVARAKALEEYVTEAVPALAGKLTLKKKPGDNPFS